MEMCYDGALVMPSSYAVMDSKEMTYVEGGDRSIKQSRAFLCKAYSLGYAACLKSTLGWTKISTYDLAAEIYSHAFGYYYFGTLLKVASSLGISRAASYLKSLKEINVDNGRDSRYWQAFNVIYAVL